jgi:Tfp pilus assembly protein PilN
MIRTNLSTRPFYNERAVHVWLFVVLLAVVAATAFNVTRVLQYSRSDTELGRQAVRDETRAQELQRQAVRQRATVDPRQIEASSAEARLANELIDRRTFSWTELFNLFETTLPDNVRITAVRPRIDQGRFELTIALVARDAGDVSEFMDRLDATRAFVQVGARVDERINEQGQLEASLQAVYRPAASGTAAGGTQ